jgi:hypothetical protein
LGFPLSLLVEFQLKTNRFKFCYTIRRKLALFIKSPNTAGGTPALPSLRLCAFALKIAAGETPALPEFSFIHPHCAYFVWLLNNGFSTH